MNKVPYSHPWSEKLVGEIAVTEVGGTPSTAIAKYWGGEIPWMASGDVNMRQVFDVPGRITSSGLASSNTKLISPPAVAIGLAGQGKTRGTVALIHIELCTNQSIAMIKGIENVLDTRYLFHNFDYRYEELRGRSSGGGRAGLSKSILEAVPIPVPPIEEQCDIARILDEADTEIRRTADLINKLKLARQGLLYDLLSYGLLPDGTPRNPDDDSLFKYSPLGRIPKEWEVKTMDDVAASKPNSTAIGPFGSNLLASDYRSEGYPVVFVRDMDELGFRWKSDIYVSDRKYRELSAHTVSRGDVLVTKMGDPPGTSCLYPTWMDDGVITADIIRLTPNTSIAIGEWLVASVNFERVAKQIRGIAGGVTRQKITLGDFRKLRVTLPTISEQQKIVQRLNSEKEKVRKEEQSLAKLRLAKKGLMDDLLTGRVRV